jgi:hypothetical protein
MQSTGSRRLAGTLRIVSLALASFKARKAFAILSDLFSCRR